MHRTQEVCLGDGNSTPYCFEGNIYRRHINQKQSMIYKAIAGGNESRFIRYKCVPRNWRFFFGNQGNAKTKSLATRGPCNCDGILICRTLRYGTKNYLSSLLSSSWLGGCWEGTIILQEYIRIYIYKNYLSTLISIVYIILFFYILYSIKTIVNYSIEGTSWFFQKKVRGPVATKVFFPVGRFLSETECWKSSDSPWVGNL